MIQIAPELYDFTDKKRNLGYYIGMMLDRTTQMFKYKNLPDTISKRNLELLVQSKGYACITKVGKDLYALFGGLGGEPDPYYMPTICTVSNPALNFSKDLKIDEDCVIIPNDSLYVGLMPICQRYGSELVENDITIQMSNICGRVPFIISAQDTRTNASAKEFVDNILKGKLSVVQEPQSIDAVKSGMELYNNSGNTQRPTDLIELQQYIKASWFNELGLSSNYNMKREAINSSEAQLGQDSLLPLVDDMLECRKLAIEKINKMFGTHIEVSLGDIWEETREEQIELRENSKETPKEDEKEETPIETEVEPNEKDTE